MMPPTQPMSNHASNLLLALLAAHPSRQSQQHDTDADSPPPPPLNITIDTSTRIMGHCNYVNLPSPAETPARIAALMTVAVKDMDMRGPRRVEIKAQSGVRICGSGNVVLTEGKRDPASANGRTKAKNEAEKSDQETESETEVQKGTKRQAESELDEMPGGKKMATNEL